MAPGVLSLERPPKAPLSEREIEILRMLKRGSFLKEIVTELGLEEFVVRSHIQRIFKKLGVNTPLEALVMATRQGLVE